MKPKVKNIFKDAITFSVLKVVEGGMGQAVALARLREAGIPARRGTSWVIGHTAVEVPARFEKRASRILWG